MPARRRGQEARRAETRRRRAQSQRDRLHARISTEEQAWREYEDGGWCCPDCDPHHPAGLLNDALAEIEAFKAEERSRA